MQGLRFLGYGPALALAAALAFLAPVARAQQGGAPPGATSTATAAQATARARSIPPDVVRLKNGGMVRGTIMELDPGDKVIIQVATGETRTYSMADVDFAGPAAEMPAASAAAATSASSGTSEQAAAPPTVPDVATQEEPPPSEHAEGQIKPMITVRSHEATVHLEGSTSGLTFFLYHGSSTTAIGPSTSLVIKDYERLCTAPCDVTLPVGTYSFGISKSGADPVTAKGSTDLGPGRSTVRGTYVSRKGVRAAGWVLFGVGVPLGIILSSLSHGTSTSGFTTYEHTGPNIALLSTGLALAGIGLIAGLIMATRRDYSMIEQPEQ